MKLFIKSEHKMFLAQYRAFFDVMQNLGVHFFKVELTMQPSKYSVIDSGLNFYTIELVQFAVVFSFGNKRIVLLGIKTAFLKSYVPAYLAVKSELNTWFTCIRNCGVVHMSSSNDVYNLFEGLLSSKFNKCRVIFFNTYLKNLYEAAFVENLKISKFVANKFVVFSKIWPGNDFNPMFFSNEDSYNEFTIIKIWALFCKVYKLLIKGDVVLDENGAVLGKYPQYWVDEYYYICSFLMYKFLMFNFYNLDSVYLSIKYMDKAKELVVENPRLLNLGSTNCSNRILYEVKDVKKE